MSDNKYICILRSNSGACEKPSAADMESMYASYQNWQQKFADNILDMGGALGSEGTIVRSDSVKDGPFVELKEVIGGYMLLTATSLEQAKAVIKASPMVASAGTSIEIRQINTP